MNFLYYILVILIPSHRDFHADFIDIKIREKNQNKYKNINEETLALFLWTTRYDKLNHWSCPILFLATTCKHFRVSHYQ